MMCLSKKILYQFFAGFFGLTSSFSSENILYVITQHLKFKENVNHS